MLKRVLVVEDDYFLAIDAAEFIRAAGAEVVGPVPRVADALALLDLEGAIDLVVLDVQLVNDTSYAVAAEAKRRSIPVAFATAYEPSAIDAEHRDVPVYQKPLDPRLAVELLKLAA